MGKYTEKELGNLRALIEIEDGIAEALRAFRRRKEQLFETEQGSRINYINEVLQTLRTLSAENTDDYMRSVEQKHYTNKQGAKYEQ